MSTTVLAKDPASLSAEDALTVGWAYAPISVQWSTSIGADACLQAAGVGSTDFFGLWMPAGMMLNIRTPSDDRNLVLCPLLLELLKAEKLPDFALHGVLFALNQGVVGRPAVVAKLLEHAVDAVDVLMGILHQASPTELVATAGHLRRPHGGVLMVMKHLVETAQAGGVDLSAQLLASGFIDTLMSALSAVEEVGADNVNGPVVCWSALGVLALLDGEALPQIEDKLRAIPSALRYAKDSNISGFIDLGMTAGTFATIVAGACLTLCLASLYWYEVAGSNTK